MPSIVLKDPDAVLDYKFDWAASTNGTGSSDWLASGETIATKTVTVPSGLTKDSDSLADTNTSVLVWLSGGTAETDYEVICHITTSDSRQDDRTLTVKVRER
jgi:hypothetical protein